MPENWPPLIVMVADSVCTDATTFTIWYVEVVVPATLSVENTAAPAVGLVMVTVTVPAADASCANSERTKHARIATNVRMVLDEGCTYPFGVAQG